MNTEEIVRHYIWCSLWTGAAIGSFFTLAGCAFLYVVCH
jgi:hypothetical protein